MLLTRSSGRKDRINFELWIMIYELLVCNVQSSAWTRTSAHHSSFASTHHSYEYFFGYLINMASMAQVPIQNG